MKGRRLVKQLKRLLNVFDDTKWDRNIRPITMLYIMGLFGTFAFSVLYTIMQFYILAAVIFFSFFVFAFTAHLLVKRKVLLAQIITFVNLSGVVIASSLIVGVEVGQHYLLLTAIVLFFSTNAINNIAKVIISILCMAEYLLMDIIFGDATPLVETSNLFVKTMRHMNIFVAFGAIIVTTIIYHSSVEKYARNLKELNRKNEYIANFDQLTGLPNRRLLYKKLDEFMVQANEQYSDFVVGVMDIDDFKNINDEHGHVCGDEVLKNSAKIIKESLRKHDIVGRWGGEEFLIILPDSNMDEARPVMDRIRSELESMIVECIDSDHLSITVTIGCAEYKPGDNIVQLIHEADVLLYQGKSSGKNVVVTE